MTERDCASCYCCCDCRHVICDIAVCTVHLQHFCDSVTLMYNNNNSNNCTNVSIYGAEKMSHISVVEQSVSNHLDCALPYHLETYVNSLRHFRTDQALTEIEFFVLICLSL